MQSINENDFSRIDLNLLVVLLVMYEVRSVTQAAHRLYLGQPAVSAALKRLREMFDDPLFVRAGSAAAVTRCSAARALCDAKFLRVADAA